MRAFGDDVAVFITRERKTRRAHSQFRLRVNERQVEDMYMSLGDFRASTMSKR
jgi:hypothetical protein